MLSIDLTVDLKSVKKALGSIVDQQLPFATALALTELASGVQEEFRVDMRKTFDNPTDFTLNSFKVIPAKKSSPVAYVQAKDIASHYLEPYVVGGNRSLWSKKGDKRGMIVPRDVGTNAFGNLTKGKLASLKGQPNVFIGRITFKKTGRTVSGVWQRNDVARGRRTKGNGNYGTKGAHNVVDGVKTTLKLLIQFEDSTPVPRRLDLEGAAQSYVAKHAAAAFDRAIRKAIATAK